jgi:BirA family transcriptional regulator, biotin operon repressor / biotin---[acetyl-CoA-carboxylase] ligase
MQLPLARSVVPNLEFVDSIDSTNLALARKHHDLADFTVLVSAEQTAGQGRAGRSWVSEKGASISLSVLLRPIHHKNSSLITLLIAASAHQALKNLFPGLAVSIKWPNDLLIGERKLAGILATLNPDQSIVAGIGINLADQRAPENAVALSELVETDFDTILAALLVKLKSNWDLWQNSPETSWLIDYLRANCSTIGSAIRADLVTGESIVGTAIDIEADGRLKVLADKEHLLAAADVWHLRK